MVLYDFELLMNDGEKVIFKENKILILTWRNLTITLKAKKHLQESSVAPNLDFYWWFIQHFF